MSQTPDPGVGCAAAGVWRLERVRVLNNATGQEALFVCSDALEVARERTFQASTGAPAPPG